MVWFTEPCFFNMFNDCVEFQGEHGAFMALRERNSLDGGDAQVAVLLVVWCRFYSVFPIPSGTWWCFFRFSV